MSFPYSLKEREDASIRNLEEEDLGGSTQTKGGTTKKITTALGMSQEKRYWETSQATEEFIEVAITKWGRSKWELPDR